MGFQSCSLILWTFKEMSANNPLLELQEDDLRKMIAASNHLGSQQCNYQMGQYKWKMRPDGVHVINPKKTWEKIILAARVIAAVENPADVCVISSRTIGQRAILKFAAATGATAIAGRYTPGTFTNQIQKAFKEPRLLVVTDPRADHQPITEASYVNIPVVAFCNTDSPLKFIDIAIPCNTKSIYSVGLMWWILAREVLRLRGTISREVPWTVMPDLYFYRDPEEAEKEEQEKAKEAAAAAAPPPPQAEEWNQTDQYQPVVEDWAEPNVGTLPPAAAAAVAPPVAEIPAAPMVVDEWGAQTTQDWAGEAPKAVPSAEWGGGVTESWG